MPTKQNFYINHTNDVFHKFYGSDQTIQLTKQTWLINDNITAQLSMKATTTTKIKTIVNINNYKTKKKPSKEKWEQTQEE